MLKHHGEMRFLTLALALTAAGCAQQQPSAQGALAAGTFSGGGRDALCIAGPAGAQRGGLIVFGPGEANCTAAGRIEPAGAGWQLVPAGDGECRIALTANAAGITLGPANPACAYYCGPGADYAGKSFRKAPDAAPATDLAGDPLC